MTPPQETKEINPHHQGVTWTSIPAPFGWAERINIGSHQDELDPTILEKLPAPFSMATTSVHKYWTSSWVKMADNEDLSEMIRIAEMTTALSHELMEALAELSKAKTLLAKLGASGYTDPKGSAET
ncbi:hypothetical protein Fot_21968 [Forsythia ovata]|uniref:Uncharacterized protein n=1 Tax=Forsythia ovata TaxID=205694 RepID=A0ABD1UWE7_9LAMI